MSSRPRGSCRGSRQLLLKVFVLLVLPLLEVLMLLEVLLIRRITGN